MFSSFVEHVFSCYLCHFPYYRWFICAKMTRYACMIATCLPQSFLLYISQLVFFVCDYLPCQHFLSVVPEPGLFYTVPCFECLHNFGFCGAKINNWNKEPCSEGGRCNYAIFLATMWLWCWVFYILDRPLWDFLVYQMIPLMLLMVSYTTLLHFSVRF